MKLQFYRRNDLLCERMLPVGEFVWTVGREESCDICLKSDFISRRHLIFSSRTDGYWVEDAGSRSGTCVDGRKTITAVRIFEDSQIEFGDMRLLLYNDKFKLNEHGKSEISIAKEKENLPAFLKPFMECSTLYTDTVISLKRRVHEYILEKLNLSEDVACDQRNQAMMEKLEYCLDQSLRDLRHEMPPDVPLEQLRQALLDELIGLGPLTPLLRTPEISEIMVNSADLVFIEYKGLLLETAIRFFNERHLISIIHRIVEQVGRHVDDASPMVDARLQDGSRVNAVIPPLALDGASLTIRKFAEKKLTTHDLIEFGSLNQEMAFFLESAVNSRQNILVSGGTGSGKTTLLNILSLFIPEGERIVTIEDSAELKLRHRNLVRLEARPANIEGKGRISIRDLVVNALRMRPDRIIVGECRGAEALDMLQAMNTGHDGSLTTCHANNPRDALSRLENMVMMAGFELPSSAIREQIVSAVNLVVQQTRMIDGSRKVTAISEVTGREGNVILLQDIFVYEQSGIDSRGACIGHHAATGNIPFFIEELRRSGKLTLDMSVFVPKN